MRGSGRPCSTARELGEVADQLITHFVNEARDAGLSWTPIGERMGVTKQAARKRFVPRDIPDEHSVLRERIANFAVPARDQFAQLIRGGSSAPSAPVRPVLDDALSWEGREGRNEDG